MLPARPGTVYVALSGGVDSAIAAALLQRAGWTVRTVFMRLWEEQGTAAPSISVAQRGAGEIARQLGLPFDVIDLRGEFRQTVVEPFAAAYLDGLTPNPCVICNQFRLGHLLDHAEAAGGAWIATGHYARTVACDTDTCIARGSDAAKDQSYVLAFLDERVRAHLVLPLGDVTKSAVRHWARALAPPVAEAPDSQEVCFAPKGYRRLLQGEGARPRHGEIVDRCGRVLGRHGGHWLYTVGQRRGLGLASERPLYVLERRAAANEIVVGHAEELLADRVVVGGLTSPVDDPAGLTVQLRYRSPAVGVRSARTSDGGSLVIELAEPFAGVAPGQAAVFYRDETVEAGGTIIAGG